jgi:hypothetical protein
MNVQIKNAIEAKFGIEVKYYFESDDVQCFYYKDENGHSEWTIEGELIYSEHNFFNRS